MNDSRFHCLFASPERVFAALQSPSQSSVRPPRGDDAESPASAPTTGCEAFFRRAEELLKSRWTGLTLQIELDKLFTLAASRCSDMEKIRAVRKHFLFSPPASAQEMARLHRTACAGDAEAQLQLGNCYENGYGLPRDPVAAVDWYRRAAGQGSDEAQLRMGLCCLAGNGVDKNAAEAVRWFRRAAEQGNAEAQFHLGGCHIVGKGVAEDLRKAVQWYRKAAEQDHPGAQRILSFCYYRGEGVEQDHAEAVKWYRKAAEQGFEPSEEEQ